MEKKEELVSKQMIRVVIKGTLVSLVFCFTQLIISAMLISNGLFSQNFIFTLTLVSAFVGIFLGTWFSLRNHKGRRWLVGTAIGFTVFLFLLVVGIPFSFSPKGNELPQVMLIAIGSGCLGGLARMKRAKKLTRR